MESINSIAILGAGAVGSFYGALMQKSGYAVQFLSSNAAKLKNKRLQLKSIWGDFQLKAEFFSKANQMVKADLIVLSTKALLDIDFKSLIDPVRKWNSIILILQNGINFEERIQKLFPKNPILGGLAFTCLNRITPVKIHHLDYGFIKLGPLIKKYTPQAKMVLDLMEKSTIKASLGKDLRRLRWEKLLWNVPFNPLSVICLESSTFDIINDPNVIELIFDLMFEVRSIAEAEGIKIPKKAIYDMVERTKKMKPYKTSMLLDFQGKRVMEVEAILGEPLRLAKKYKIQVPKIESIYQLLSYYDMKNRE